MVTNSVRRDRPRILVLADDCNPYWHSLPALVYSALSALSKYVDLVVVTQIRNRPNIDQTGLGSAEVVYIDTEIIAGPLHRLASFLSRDENKGMTLKVALNYPSYLAFEWAAWRRFRRELMDGAFDVVHRFSPMSPTIPSPIASWSPVPFVIGPILGGLPWPNDFKAEMNREGEWMNYFRAIHRWLPFYQSTYYKAAAILAAYDHTISDIPLACKAKTINFSEGGVDPSKFIMPVRQKRNCMTILFVGRLVPFKMAEVLVLSFAGSPILRKHKLIIVGDGPERRRLETIIADNSLSGSVNLTGTVSHDRVGELMRESEIFAFPSVREQGGGVLTLAMMSGMACVVVDYGGPAVRVKHGCGIKIPMGDLNHLIRSYTNELEALVDDYDRVIRMGINGRQYTETFYSWDAKAKKTVEVYDWVLGRREEKPNFWDHPFTPVHAT